VSQGSRVFRARALKLEIREKLDAAQPGTLAAAGRLQGVTPAALVMLRLRAKLESAESAAS
jgi:tRNA U34 5-carboxymethylaminomethyl modifying enzyme MnmG/GidA